MNDIEFFATLCTKDELIKFINIFDINISGFSRNLSKAPEKLIRSKFINKIAHKNFVVFDKICEVACSVYDSSDMPEDFNSFILLMLNKKDYISEADIFCFLAKKFPEKKTKFMPQLIENNNKGNHILKVFINNLNVTKENAFNIFMELNDTDIVLENFYDIYRNEIRDYYKSKDIYKEYTECLEKLKDVTWAEFVDQYINMLNEHKESIIFFAYLDGNKDMIMDTKNNDIKNIYLLMVYEVVIDHERNISKIKSQELKIKDKDLKDLQDNYNLLNKQYERLEKSHKKLEKKLGEIRSKNQNIIEELQAEIRSKEKIIDSKNNQISKLNSELESKVNKEVLFEKWGETNNDLKLVIISYDDSNLFNLFFGKYNFIDSSKSTHNITNMLQKYSAEFKIIINKAKLNTGKLLNLEDNLKDKNKTTIFANNPRELIIKTIPHLEGRI